MRHLAGLPGTTGCSKSKTGSRRCLGFQEHATSCSNRPQLRCSSVLSRAHSPASPSYGQPLHHSTSQQQWQQQEQASNTATIAPASGVLHSSQPPVTSLLQSLRALCQSLAHLSSRVGSRLAQAAGWAAVCLLLGLLLPARVALGRARTQPTLALPLASMTVSTSSRGLSTHQPQSHTRTTHSSRDADCSSCCSYSAGVQHATQSHASYASPTAASALLDEPLSQSASRSSSGPQPLYMLAGAARSQPQQQAPAPQPTKSSEHAPATGTPPTTTTAPGAPGHDASQAAASTDATAATAAASNSAGGQQAAAGQAAGGVPASPSAPPSPATAPPLTGEEVLTAVDTAVQNLFTSVQPLVVNVSGARASSTFSTLDITRPPAGSASGLVWDDRGHVVCPYSAVRGSAEVKVAFADAATYTAKVVGWDAAKDIAVLRLSMPKQKLKELVGVTLGSSSTAAIGQSVFVVGNATGLDHTLTRGIISGLGRELPSSGPYPQKGLIQVDAPCGHQAGGALLDAKGRVLGIVCAPFVPGGRAAGYGLGYALPVDTVRGLVDQIVVAGRATRPALGITLAPPQVLAASRAEGVLVLEVHHGSPGHAAGVRPTHRDIFGDIILGDVIVGLDARPVRHAGDLYAALDMRKPGDRVRLDILRDGKATSLTLVLGERGAAGAFED